MVSFLQKYKQVTINTLILIALFAAFITSDSALKDALPGFVFGAILIRLRVSIADLKRKRNQEQVNISGINE